MLKKQFRLKTNDVKEVLGQKTSYIKANNIRISFVLGGEKAQFAVIVPKKKVKGAVKRHFVKRAIFNQIKPLINDFPSGKYLIFADSDFGAISKNDIESDLKFILKRLLDSNN